MHGNALKAAIAKHGHLTGAALAHAVNDDQKGYSLEEQHEIIQAIGKHQSAPQFDGDGPEVMQDAVQPDYHFESGIKVRNGKHLYDKWRGQWVAVEAITNPFNGDRVVITWRFERLGLTANKTNIPMTPDGAKLFNESRRIEAANTPTEQLFRAGAAEDIYHRKSNPFHVQTL